eukprot:900507-Pyramimonas_sp.AAC.1
MAPHKGTRPGVPLADADFNLLIGRVHRMHDSYLEQRGLRAQGRPLESSFACATDPTDGPHQEHEPHGLSFVDDLTGMH